MGYARPHGIDNPTRFVAGDGGVPGPFFDGLAVEVQVAAAQPARHQLDDDFARTRDGVGIVADFGLPTAQKRYTTHRQPSSQ